MSKEECCQPTHRWRRRGWRWWRRWQHGCGETPTVALVQQNTGAAIDMCE
jgi:hypothetical protein